MKTAPKRFIASASHPDGALAERLLDHMKRIHNHDLPNQIVALQSLLHLLNFEESANLSKDGREYVRRLQKAARRAGDLVRFLKDIGRLNTFTCTTETIYLANLARELQGELQRQFPERKYTFAWQWNVPEFVGDPRVYLHAILELCRASLSSTAMTCAIEASSRLRGDAIELEFRAHAETADSDHGAAVPVVAWADRMEVILAREWLALSNGRLETTVPIENGHAFSIVVPNPFE